MAQGRKPSGGAQLERTLARLEQSLADSARVAAALEATSAERRADEERHRGLLEHAPLPAFAYDRETLAIIAASERAVEAYGYSRAELLAMRISDLRPPEDVEAFERHVADVRGWIQRGDTPEQPWCHMRKDGELVEVEVVADDVALDGRACRLVITREVTERNRAVRRLARERAAAQEHARIRSRLLANLDHEVRAPLHGLIAGAGALAAGELTAEQHKRAQELSRGAKAVLASIEDMLNIAEIETARALLDLHEFAVRQLVTEVCDTLRPAAESKGLALELEIDEAVPRLVNGDARRLRRIAVHLLDNAIRFTDEGVVTVSLSSRRRGRAATTLRLEVTDSGIGLAPEMLDSVFGAFVQAESRRGGAGLGLAIVRAFGALMGGTTGAESRLGKGSRFWVELPLSISAQSLTERAVERQPSRSYATAPRRRREAPAHDGRQR
jgi:PAS domain S-box-containing protein